MPKTWRLQGGSDTLTIVRRADIGKGEKTTVNPALLSARLDRWLADPFSRKAILEMYESMGGHPIRSGQTNQRVLTRTVKLQLEKAFQRGDLVALRTAPPPRTAGLPIAPLIPLMPPPPAPSSAKPVKPAAAVKKAKLRVVLIDKNNKAISDKAWELLGPVRAVGKTGGNGLIEVGNLNLEYADGSLNVDMGPVEKKKPVVAKTASPPPASSPPPYPAPIKADDFKDKNDPASGGDQTIVEWSLSLQLVKDMESDGGVKARLHNLGFNCDAKSDGPTTNRAVKAYQRLYQKKEPPSGSLTEIQSDVKKRHDTL